MADEIQNTGIQFEDIVPWVDAHGDTGLSARLKLKRNFDKIKAWMDSQGVDRNIVRQMIEEMGAELFLSKVEEDIAQEPIGFMKGFWIKAKELFGITEDGDAKLRNLDVDSLVRAADIQSPSYTGDGMADTGFRLTARDNTGSSKLTIDNLYVRKKATFEELEVRKETAIAGNQIYSGAANVVIRTEYYGVEDTTDPSAPIKLLGFSILKTPWLLKKVPFLLRGQFFGRTRKTRIYLDAEDIEKIRFVRCYFLAKDDEREVYNLWKVQEFREVNGVRVPVDGTGNDLARCQTMNLRNSKRPTYIRGFEGKAGNVYWWRKLCGVSSEPAVLEDGRQYHFIDITFDYAKEEAYRQSGQLCPWCDLASGDIPAAGDHVVQFGNDMNPDRMNLIAVEVNSSSDAPAIKWYRGIYTFDLSKCWWGGNPRKNMISAASGAEFYGPDFKIVTENGVAKVPKDRDEVLWNSIVVKRDDYSQHTNVRKCYNYDAITHNGARWLCLVPEGVHWVRPQQFDNEEYALFDAEGLYRHNGNYISDADYSQLTSAQRAQCGRIPNYTTAEPGTDAQIWKEIVSKGESGKGISSIVARYLATSASSGVTTSTSGWTTAIQSVTPTNKYLWKYETTTYTDGSTTNTTPVIIGVYGDDGVDGKDGWMITANPANVIITQELVTTSTFTSASVTFTAKKGNVAAQVLSLGTLSWNHFAGSKSGTTITVTSPTINNGSYYSEGSFTVVVNVKDPDTSATVSFNVTVMCYANLLGSWKQSVEAGEEQIAANKIIYALGASGNTIEKIKTDYTSKRNSIGKYEMWESASESTDGSKANMIKKTTEAQSTADGVSTKVGRITTTSGTTTHIIESEVTQYADLITAQVYTDLGTVGMRINGTDKTVNLQADSVNLKPTSIDGVAPLKLYSSDESRALLFESTSLIEVGYSEWFGFAISDVIQGIRGDIASFGARVRTDGTAFAKLVMQDIRLSSRGVPYARYATKLEPQNIAFNGNANGAWNPQLTIGINDNGYPYVKSIFNWNYGGMPNESNLSDLPSGGLYVDSNGFLKVKA